MTTTTLDKSKAKKAIEKKAAEKAENATAKKKARKETNEKFVCADYKKYDAEAATEKKSIEIKATTKKAAAEKKATNEKAKVCADYKKHDIEATAAEKKAAKEKAEAEKPKKITRADSFAEAVKRSPKETTVETLITLSDEIYAEAGGKANLKESKWFFNYGSKLLIGLGIFTIEDKKVTINNWTEKTV